MAHEDFTLHFEIPVHTSLSKATSPRELERAFAQEQIATLLKFVTLYQDGQALRPDAFSIVNAPGSIYSFVADTTR